MGMLHHLDRFSSEEQEQILKALDFATRYHEPQRRISGEPYIMHPVAVAQALVDEFKADAETVMAGLLHDTVEDTPATLDDIEQEFGPRVRFLVDGATDVGRGDGKEPIEDWEERWKATMVKAREYGAKDKGVFLVKIADRMHNLSTCASMRPKNQVRMARTTSELHLQIAKQLGLKQAEELQRLCSEVLQRNQVQQERAANQRHYLR